MKYYVSKKEVERNNNTVGHTVFPLLNEEHGCVAGCCTGISLYNLDEFPPPGLHDFQEGFIVMEGTGWAKVGDEEFRLEPDVSFIAPAGTKHTIKKDPSVKHIKLFWFHASIKE